jgi:NAD(P)-dependent dehydrogenase (short-subunit alcohol dehydrogenase family)
MNANAKTALVTGAARRIGRRIALDLAADGWAVIAHYNSSDLDAKSLINEIRAGGGRAALIQGDLSDGGAVKSLLPEATSRFGPVTCLINNASCFEPDEVGAISGASLDQHLNINLKAPVLLSQAFAAELPAPQTGNIINIIDQRVLKLNPRYFSYTLSKAALWTATRTLAQALAPNIRVNAIGPGPALPNVRMDESEFAKQSRLTLLERGTSPEEISQALRFLLSSPAITGQMVVLDGGQHLMWQTPDILNVRE